MVLQGSDIVGTEWSMVILTFLLVALRIYVRLERATQKGLLPLLSDAFVVLAWLSFLLQAILDTLLYRLDFFDVNVDVFRPELGGTAVMALKVYFVKNLTYVNCMYAVKAAMLCLYHDFFPTHMKMIRKCLIAVDAMVIASFMAENFAVLFWCLPISRNWSLDANAYCSSNSSVAAWVIGIVPHLLTDVLIYALPLPVIFSLRFSRKQLYGLAGAFAIGFLCVFMAAANCAGTFLSATVTTSWMFTIFEQTNAVIVACCPALQALFRFGFKNRPFRTTQASGAFSTRPPVSATGSRGGLTEPADGDESWYEESKVSNGSNEGLRDLQIGVDVEIGVVEFNQDGPPPNNGKSVITTRVVGCNP